MQIYKKTKKKKKNAFFLKKMKKVERNSSSLLSAFSMLGYSGRLGYEAIQTNKRLPV